jgi:two-component system response regulator AtoC
LYYRINVFRIDLPPLRDRTGDIAQLTEHFLSQKGYSINAEAMQKLSAYEWPGNVRELENILERATIVCRGEIIKTEHLPADIQSPQHNQSPDQSSDEAVTLSIPQATEKLERRLIENALKQTSGNKSKAAKLLEISERSLWYKVSSYKIEK